MTRLLHEIAHLGHAGLLTPEPDKSLWFFTEVLGLTENGTSGDSVYLRTWDDYEHHSLKLNASVTSGIGRTGLRAASEQALNRRVAEIERHGSGVGWQDGDLGIGPAYLFRDPDGHEFELYWETERYQPTGELTPALKNQAQAYPGRGVSVRRAAQARHPADVLPLCLRARREPDRAVQPVRPADLRAGRGDHHLVRGRAGEGTGLGAEDDCVVPHARNAAHQVSRGKDRTYAG